MLPLVLAPLLATKVAAQAGVIASGPNGPTNPDVPYFMAVGSQVDQQSLSRLMTVNSVDDFCMWGPPEPGPDSLIGNTEHEVVAWCTKPRNGARLIPDGTIKSAQLLRTPGYIQVSGTWDGTIVNIPLGDDGGEMDPHGPTGEGNPVGGNVTTNMVGGQDVFYEEWMSFVSDRHFCVRICTAVVDNIPTALMCEHELDIMGCNFVMAIPWGADEEGFTECDSEVAAPPGLYPQSDGSYSTFRQRFTGTWDGAVHTIGNTVTPSAPAFYPSSSNCRTWSTISNGVDTTDFVVRAAPTFLAGGGLSSGASVVSVASTSLASLAPVTTHTSEQTSSKAAVSPSASADASSGSTNKDDDKESSASKASGSPTSSAANPTGSSNAAASKSPLSVAAVLAAFGGVLLAVL